jgi:hypothetical protein
MLQEYETATIRQDSGFPVFSIRYFGLLDCGIPIEALVDSLFVGFVTLPVGQSQQAVKWDALSCIAVPYP